MRSQNLKIIAAVAAACLALPLLAQQREEGRGKGPGGPGGGGGMMMFGGGFGISRLALLRVESVQKELELVEEQVAAIQKLQEELRGPGGPGGPGFRGPPGGDGQRRRGDGDRKGDGKNPDRGASQLRSVDWYFVQAQQAEQGKERRAFGGGQFTEEQRREFEQARLERTRQEKAKLAEILLPHQLKRLNEIYYQQIGAGVLDDEDVAKELNIASAQKEQIAKVREENQAAAHGQMQELQGGDREASRRKIEELRKTNDNKVFALLSADQKQKLDELRGKPFDLPPGALFAGRGGPGGPGGKGRGPEGDKNRNP